ncbi:multicomponent Na+:H+ antiporter subunit C [Halanaerobium saccharolyticum]|uniref:Multicomponent Na+:H+ antiporter subunit C n=1 Tax=Halanaerobium saccharolyticum TaxID=43595 RepID=A0A4R6LKN3_9FIRM|nr:cation:proton antiporter subunit C [Halanaerobium saccharolyticum]TDO85258.1 multicomponent Na+:H+ antiporter subunit C [Halanaerobium saccharolyticum]
MFNNLIFIILFMLGFYALVMKTNLIKNVIGLNIMEAAVFFWVISFSDVGGEVSIHKLGEEVTKFNDPVPQALTLTGIVIGASTAALLLTLIIELNKFSGTIDREKIEGLND